MTDPQIETPRDRLFLALLGWIDCNACTCDGPACRPYLRKIFDQRIDEIIADDDPFRCPDCVVHADWVCKRHEVHHS